VVGGWCAPAAGPHARVNSPHVARRQRGIAPRRVAERVSLSQYSGPIVRPQGTKPRARYATDTSPARYAERFGRHPSVGSNPRSTQRMAVRCREVRWICPAMCRRQGSAVTRVEPIDAHAARWSTRWSATWPLIVVSPDQLDAAMSADAPRVRDTRRVRHDATPHASSARWDLPLAALGDDRARLWVAKATMGLTSERDLMY
jgi:hypothetical protein